jgi:hypothetical protein
MLVLGNGKLGAVWHFSIPAHESCPGESTVCANFCYASRHFFRYPNTIRAHNRNYRATRRRNFIKKILKEIDEKQVEILRLHSSGDFSSAAYVRMWVSIAKKRPAVQLFCYSRSWRVPRIRKALHDFARLPNVAYWHSCDIETHAENGRPPRWRGTRCAWMLCDPDEFVPSYVDLVFRTKRKTVQKYVAGRLCCPAENGTHPKQKTTCEKCRLCIFERAIPRKVA